MSTGHLVLASTDQDQLKAALHSGVATPQGDTIYNPSHQSQCPGPPHPNLFTALIQADACAEIICSICDDPVCAACDTGYCYQLDTGRVICERCEGKPLWASLAELEAESQPRYITVVHGCFSCAGEETPERSATIVYTTAAGSRKIHWMCRACVAHHGPEKALSGMTQDEMHPQAHPVFDGTSPTRRVLRITQGPGSHNPAAQALQ